MIDAGEIAARWNNIPGLAWNIIPIDGDNFLRLKKKTRMSTMTWDDDRIAESIAFHCEGSSLLHRVDAIAVATLVREDTTAALQAEIEALRTALDDVTGTLQTERAWTWRSRYNQVLADTSASIVTDAPA